MDKIKELKDEFNLTVVMTEHDLCVVKEIGDRVALLRDKKLLVDIDLDKIKSSDLCRLFK